MTERPAPRVTVLMPVYNGMPFLSEAIASVLAQTFGDFELLIIDDASTDAAVAACLMSFQDPRIRLVHNERNLGQVATLNRGLGLAQGEYIARLDQDDVCLPERLEEQVALLDRAPDLAIVCTWEHSIDADGTVIRSWRRTLDNYGTFLGQLLVGKCPVWHPSVMFRRVIIAALGGYDPSYGPSEDYELWFRIARHRHGAAIVPRVLVLQRCHGGRQSITRQDAQVAQTRRALTAFLEQFVAASMREHLVAFLLLDDAFLRTWRSKEQQLATLRALDELVVALARQFQLNHVEYAAFTRVLARQFGMRRPSAQAWRWLPEPLWQCALFTRSPFLVPGARQAASTLYHLAHEAQHPRAFVRSRWRAHGA